MKTANISYAKNHLSELVAIACRGEPVIIMDRRTPVARLEPVSSDETCRPDWMLSLVRSGVVKPARRKIKAGEISKMVLPVPDSGDAVESLLANREEDR